MTAARIAILALFVSLALSAESPSKIEIKVTDRTGAPIAHARAQALRSELKISAEIESDAQGEAVLHLEPGTYTVSVSAKGFNSWRRSMIQLSQNSDVSIQAELRPGELRSFFVVNDEKVIQIDHPQLAASIV